MEEKELTKQASSVLGIEVSDPWFIEVWRAECSDGHGIACKVLDGSIPLNEYLTGLVRRYGSNRKKVPGTAHDGTSPLTAREIAKAEAFSSLIALDAAKREDVKKWRDKYLERLLSLQEMRSLLHNEYLGYIDFEKVSDPDLWKLGVNCEQLTRLTIEDGENTEPIFVTKRYMFGSLRTLADNLCESYEWSFSDASRWVLTGEIPFIAPIQSQLQSDHSSGLQHHTITIMAEAWVSSKTIASLYRSQQVALWPGRENRGVHQRAWTVVKTVATMETAHGKSPSWQEALEQWKKDVKGKGFEDIPNAKAFQQDYCRAMKELKSPVGRSGRLK